MANKNWSDVGRVCKNCQEFKDLSNFNLRKSGSPYTLCRPCYALDIKRRAALKLVLEETNLRVCPDCKITKQLKNFPKNANSAGGYLNRCKLCYSARNSMASWGIDVKQYTNCAICKEKLDFENKGFAVDHDHKCCPQNKSCGKCVRGVLCSQCNIGLGMFRDNPGYLINAANYLKGVIQL